MKVVNILRKKEYFMFFKFVLFHFITMLLISDYLPHIVKKIYRINFSVFSLYNIYCIFIESSFDNKFVKILQNELHKYNLFFASFLGLVQQYFC